MMQANAAAAVMGCVVLLSAASLEAKGLRGTLGAEGVYFFDAPLYEDQAAAQWQPTIQGSVDWATAISRDTKLTLNVFGRASTHADDSLAGDIREAAIASRWNSVDVKAGVLSETWAVLEAWNPVDIINQRDLVEDFQGEVKLGQPGMSASMQRGHLVLSVLGMTYARERRYAEGEDRLRLFPAPIEATDFESGQWAPSTAVRAQYRWDALDVAVSQFYGHAREPVLEPRVGPGGLTGFDALYQRIAQTSTEIQYVVGDSVLKNEIIYQSGGIDDFWGGGVGMETTVNKLGGGFQSLTFYVEAYADGRSTAAPVTAFQRDVFLGARYNLNDTADTLFEARYTYDLEWHSDLVDLRSSRRVLDDCLIFFQLLLPLTVDSDPALGGLAEDAYFKAAFDWYF